MAGVTVFMLEWSEAHFKDSLINSSVGENYVIDLLKYDKKPPVMVLNHAYVHNTLAGLRIMNEAEDGGAESLASKFEIQRHQFLYRVDTCRSAAERLSSSGCSRRRRRSTGAALPQARPGTAAPKQRHYSPSHLQAPSRHAAASTHSPLTGSSRAEEAIGRGGRRRGGAARMQGRCAARMQGRRRRCRGGRLFDCGGGATPASPGHHSDVTTRSLPPRPALDFSATPSLFITLHEHHDCNVVRTT